MYRASAQVPNASEAWPEQTRLVAIFASVLQPLARILAPGKTECKAGIGIVSRSYTAFA